MGSTILKHCPKCNVNKPFDSFHKNTSRNDGLHLWCKGCRKIETKTRMVKHDLYSKRIKKTREQIKEQQHQWRIANAEYVKEQKRQDYLAKRETYIQRAKLWRENNPLKVKGIVSKYRTSDKGRLSMRLNVHKRQARIVDDGTITRESITNLYNHQRGLCAISGASLDKGYHIDHIIPLSKGGLHTITNIQLLLPEVNLRKGNKLDFELVPAKVV